MTRYQYNLSRGKRVGLLSTAHGTIPLPAFFPVTTYGDNYPLDKMVRPYLNRLAPCIMVSYHYAQKMQHRPSLPLFIDSGGFAGLFAGSKIEEHGDHSCIRTKDGEEIHPLHLLHFQEQHADIGATLDFIIPPGTEVEEAKRLQKLTIQNAIYAKQHLTSPDLILFASLQCWDEDSARQSAGIYASAGFEGIAIGGYVPRANDPYYIKTIVRAVRDEAPDCAIHVFGCGSTTLLPELTALGADSFDSSSYVRGAINSNSSASGIHLTLYSALVRLHETISAVTGVNTPVDVAIPNTQIFH